MLNNKRIQYIQIDFLRLFRLCRELGIVKRKRKMPNQYTNTSQIDSSLSKLFKSFLTGLFEDYEINKTNGISEYYVKIPERIKQDLLFIKWHINIINDYEDNEFLEKYNSFFPSRVENIIIHDNFNFSIYINRGMRYSSIISSINGGNISRPREEYYNVAKSCVEFKKGLDSLISDVCIFVSKHKNKIYELVKEKQDKELKEKEKLILIMKQKQEEILRAREEAANRIKNLPQQLFNEALERRRMVAV